MRFFVNCTAAFVWPVALSVAAGCARFLPERDPTAVYLHLAAEPATLNPITATDAYASAVNQHIYESLLDIDYDTLQPRPQLAERWQVLDGGMRYRFYLKKGVKWSDGVPFTADDVVYSFQRIKDPKVACAHLKVYYLDIKRCVKIDTHTVEFTYARPYFLALNFCGGMPIVPRHLFDDGKDFNTHPRNRSPVGTGPFVFERWETGKRIVLTRNERFHGKKPAIRRLIYTIVMEPSVALQMLKKGEIDAMDVRVIEWVRQTGSEKFRRRFYKLMYYQPIFSYVGWNAARPFFRDRRVRIAMTHLINKREILDKLLFGIGKPVTGPFYVFGPYYNHDLRDYPYDPAEAKRLLREAGWIDRDGDGVLDKDGRKFSFVFTIPSASKFGERLGTIMKEDLAKVGIEMSINRYEWAVFLQKIQARDFDATTLRWAGGFEEDPYQIWHSSQIRGGSNYVGFRDEEADRIIEAARMEFNPNKRAAMYRRFHAILHREQPYTFLYTTPNLVVVSRRFGNVVVHKRGLNLLEWTLEDAR